MVQDSSSPPFSIDLPQPEYNEKFEGSAVGEAP